MPFPFEAVVPSSRPRVANRWRHAAGRCLLLFLLSGLSWPAPRTHAAVESNETFTTLTNRNQLAQLHEPDPHLQWTANVEGTVLTDGNELVLVHFDDLDQFKIINARGSASPLKRGQRIRYCGSWFIGEGNDHPDRWATVNNEGMHSMVASSGRAVLTAGRHPIRLLYVNAGGSLGLEVSYEGPGCPKQRVPAEALWHQTVDGSHTNWVPGIAFRLFEGDWQGTSSPWQYFATNRPTATGTVPNFDLTPAKSTNQFGMEFTGFIELPRTGMYEFTTVSDDGSLLFIDEEPPEISVLGFSRSTPLKRRAAGQAWEGAEDVTGGALSGIASFAHQSEDGLDFELSGDNGRTFAHLLNPGPLTPKLLNGSRVQATGLLRKSLTPEGLEVAGQLLIPSEAAVEIMNLPNQIWSTLPVKSIPGLRATPQDGATPVRVSGRLRQKQQDGSWVFGDDMGELSVELHGADAEKDNQPVELLLSGAPNASGSWSALAWRRLAAGQETSGQLLPVLTSIEEVKKLTRAEAQRGYPVTTRGVVTLVWQDGGFFLQDDSWSIYVRTSNTVSEPYIGDFREIDGYTFAEFAPNIHALSSRRLGAGTLPEPAHPTLQQLIDGSLDTKYIEIQGVVSAIDAKRVILLTREGRIRIQLPNLSDEILERSLNALVRIRGCVVPGRELLTQRVLIGEVGLMNAQLTIERPPPEHVFDAPAKTVPELLLFEAQLTSLQRVKVYGQILHQRGQEFFFVDGTNGARFITKTLLTLLPGDFVEIVGFPDLKGPTPLLRDAAVRLTNSLPLPQPIPLPPDQLLSPGYDSTRVQVEAHLLAQRRNQTEQVLELQIGARTFLARMQNKDGNLPALPTGSTLVLRGVYVGLGGDRVAGREIDSFELLLNAPNDVRITRLPSWWTTRHALVVLAVLGSVLVLAMSWIFALRRRVAQRTQALTEEIKDHERTEQQLQLKTHMLEKEIEERLRMEQEIEKGHKQLLATSRLAGMAEVATSVLHNVGNVMTSVNVLSSAIVKQVHQSKVPNVTRLGDLLRQNQEHLDKFITEDQRGQMLPTYVSDLGGHLAQEQSTLIEKVNALKENIHHINEIVALQQDYTSVTGLLEKVAPVELVENALRMQGESMKRHHIALIRQFQNLRPVTIDRHKTLQILFNLLENAKHACLQTNHAQHEVVVSLRSCDADRFELSVTDNGMGISAENLPRIFDQGFSTRRDGHGFGLHSSILMAQDMGGTLTVQSKGPGQGASFTVCLPNNAPKPVPHAQATAPTPKTQ